MSEIKSSLVLPCYNEELNLRAQEAKLLQIPDLIKGELILVDNGSRDGTADFIRYLNGKNPRIVLVSVTVNEGYGNGILCGLNAAQGHFLGWTHSDGQFDLLDCVKAFKILLSQSQPEKFFVMGRRAGRPFGDRVFTLGMAIFESLLFQMVLYDISAQPKIMTRSFYLSLKNAPKDFALDLYVYVMAKRQGMEVLRFQTPQLPRVSGASSWNTGLRSRLKLIRRILGFSLRLRVEQL
ncbi:glycosyltransferase family 2 protein [Bdellovibrio sp. HCB209]|uniref:glycosyltransferase family 2 protein n=1 Tax=Bdellovibrio sp. HCB209 TaxID=3394354 RepID=UPI0039B63AAD